jgi:hypothetical protein
VNELSALRIRTRVVPIVLASSLALLSACSPQNSPPAATAAPPATPKASSKNSKLAFAGTINVPQRRPVVGAEMTPEIAQRARAILDENSGAAFGTEVPFEIDGQSYIGRIEEHYHEPGGPKKPWGRHRGVTVYHAE